MTRGHDSPDDYVFQVHNITQRYVQDLMRQNNTLREVMASVENQRCDLEKQLISTQAELETQAMHRSQLQEKLT